MNLELKMAILRKCGTQFVFSKLVMEHESSISRVIKGKEKLSLDRARKWQAALGCTPDVLESCIAGE